MNNGDFNPVGEGFAPIPEETVNESVPAPAPSAQVGKYQAAKKAFGRACLAFLILFLAVQVIGAVVAGIGAGIATAQYMLSGGLDDLVQNVQQPEQYQDVLRRLLSDYRKIQQQIGPMITLFTIIGTGVGLAGGIFIEKAILKKIPAAPITKKKLSVTEYFFMLLVALGLWGAGAILGNLPGLFGLGSPLDGVFSSAGVSGIIMTVYAMIGAPILEELACRKLLLDKLAPYGEVPAAFLSALLFGLFHGNSTQFPLAFMVGLAFATVYMKTGNILYSMSFHVIINTIGSIGSIAQLAGASEKALTWIGYGQFILMGVLAVAGITLAAIKRNSPLLALRRPDYLGCNSVMFRNPGYIIFLVVSIVTVVSMDAAAIIMNLTEKKGALTLLCLIPTALFFVMVFGVMKKVGKKASVSLEIEENAVNPEE